MLQWKAELWYSDNLLVASGVAARDVRDATEQAILSWRQLEAAGEIRAGILELADRVVVTLCRRL
jgi:hypothetical protein